MIRKFLTPDRVRNFLKWFCKEQYQEEILGDLDEVYTSLVAKYSIEQADRKFLRHALKFIRFSNVKKLKPMKGINHTLFKRGIKYSLKQYKLNFGHSMINSIGLAIGIAGLITLMAYTYQQLSFDKQYSNSDRIFRVVTDTKVAGNIVPSSLSSARLLPTVSKSLNEIEHAVRMYSFPCFLTADKLKKYREGSFVFADSTLVDVFDFEFKQGNAKTALDGPLKVILTEKMAVKYFGNKSPIGQKITFEDQRSAFDFNVTGVIKDLPENTHLKADFFASMQSLDQIMPWYYNWHYPPLYSYVKLSSSDTSSINSSFDKIFQEQVPEHYRTEVASIKFQNIEDINLQSNYESDWKANSSMVYVKIFVIVAILILIISVVNYVNLVVSRGVVRAKEVGVRKVIGADRKQLIFQFMTEALVNVFIAALISTLLIFLFTYLFNRNLDISLSFEFLSIWPFNILLIGIFFLLVFLAGFYPALIMSNYRLLDSFKQKLPTSGSSLLRKGLVFFQFVISGTMILMTLLMLSQSRYLQNRNLGFEEEHLVSIKMMDESDSKNYEVFKNDLLVESFVESAAISSTLPGKGDFFPFDVSSLDNQEIEPFSMKSLGVDEDYISTYDIKLKSGRDFDTNINTDERSAFILNKAAAAKFGWEDPIGKNFRMTVYAGQKDDREGKVIGMVEDFNFESLHKEIEPIVIYINKHRFYTDYLTVKLKPGGLSNQIARLNELYSEFNPNKPFEFSFIDDELDSHYENEIKQGKTMTIFSVVAIVLSCLGILGLITYATQKKMKEIGIRKIMGSGRFQIFFLFVKEYLTLFLPAIVVSGGLVYFFSKDWLSNFAFSIDFNISYYLVGYLALAVITLLTISYHTIRASALNPVDCLRDE